MPKSILIFIALFAAYQFYTRPKNLSAYQVDSGCNVVIFSTSSCPYCQQAKAFFETNKIPWCDKNIEDSEANYATYKSLGGKGVPLVLIGATKINGFSAARYQQALAESSAPTHIPQP